VASASSCATTASGASGLGWATTAHGVWVMAASEVLSLVWATTASETLVTTAYGARARALDLVVMLCACFRIILVGVRSEDDAEDRGDADTKKPVCDPQSVKDKVHELLRCPSSPV
jgi:hypothetical protein